ncbi:PqiA family integral membrane protein [Raoultella terrigena]|uniref:PqiA family integral membrane protein n=1 Tax=Raoultella terrigena TaxID=577 RepID=A0A7Z8Z8N5_RAOTE|nr:PqiA family integral membrane protein [Raoultella terrigena]
MTVHAVGSPLPQAHYHRCPQCDILFRLPVLKRNQSAWCPRCSAKIRDGRDWSLSRLGSMAIAMMLLMPFAWMEPLLRLHLLGVRIDANVLQGIWQMTDQGDPLTAAMVLFCAIGAPALLVISIAYLWLGNVLGMNLRPVLLMLERLKEWVMLDIYLVGIGVASIKVQDYAFLQPGVGLIAFVSLTLLSILTLIHMNVEELWERFYPERPALRPDPNLQVCTGCHYTGHRDARGRCRRCHTPLRHRRPQSLQKSWAALIASMMFLLPANLLRSRLSTLTARARTIRSSPGFCRWPTATSPLPAWCLSPVFWCRLPKLLCCLRCWSAYNSGANRGCAPVSCCCG